MTHMKTKIFAIISCAVLLAAGCKDKNHPGPSQAEPLTGSVETPAWADLLFIVSVK